jgi:surface polysaccharide O-acyltransferase-like enzyme
MKLKVRIMSERENNLHAAPGNGVYPIDAEYSARIDILKVILIIMVVYIHSHTGQLNFTDQTVDLQAPQALAALKTVVSGIICRIATPLFMLISSVLLFRKPFTWAGNMKKKLRSVGVPYLFWNSLWILVFFIGQSIPYFMPFFPNPDNLVRNFGFLDWVMAYTGNPLGSWTTDWYPFYYPFWFLKDLFIFNLLAPVIRRAVDKAPVTVLSVALLCWLCDVKLFLFGTETFLFFILGCYVVRYRLDIRLIDGIRLIDLLPLYAVMITVQYFWGRLLPFAADFTLLLGVVVFIRLSRALYLHGKSRTFFTWLSSCVFIIYSCHEFTLSFCRKLLGRLLPQNVPVQIFAYLLLPLIITALLVCGALLLRKLSPRFYALVTGGR